MNNAAPTFYNRPAIEREIESIENPHGMRLNDAKERPILPGGTLRRLLVVIDAQAGRIADLEAQLASGQEPVAWFDEEMQSAYTQAELDGGAIEGLIPLYTHGIKEKT